MSHTQCTSLAELVNNLGLGQTPVAHSEELRLGSQGTRVRIPLTAGKVDSEPSNLTLADLAAAVIPATGRSSRLLYSLPQEGVAGHSTARCQKVISAPPCGSLVNSRILQLESNGG